MSLSSPDTPSKLERPLPQISTALLTAFLAIALTLIFWSIVRSGSLLSREDNPRLIQAEQRIARGTILDQNDQILAASQQEEGIFIRKYANRGFSPVVGYYSIRHGTAGVEEGFDAILRGTPANEVDAFRQNLLHLPQMGGNVRLTLDTAVQTQANNLLKGQTGALILLTLPDAHILALASQPGYNPNLLDEQFDTLAEDDSAPLLNRATQGQYQPGRILTPFVMAAAFNDGLIAIEDTPENTNQPVTFDNVVIQCDSVPPENANWADILRLHCPAPFAELGKQWGAAGIHTVLDSFGLTRQPPLPINLPEDNSSVVEDPALAALGQDTLTVTPLQVALALAALGNGGQVPLPQLVTAVQPHGSDWQTYQPVGTALPPAIAPTTAARLRRILPSQADFLEYAVLVLAGPEGVSNAWYMALTPAVNPQFALVIVLEKETAVTDITRIGRQLINNLGFLVED